MNKELLFDSFSHLDESLLERSEAAKRYVPWRDILKTAACFAVLIGALAVPFVARRNVPVATPSAQFATSADAEAAEHEWAASYTPEANETDNWDTPPVVGSPAIAMLPNNASAEIPVLPWVESYPMDVDSCYTVPKNGEVGYSIPLREAMEEYGDNARYRVVVDRFQNEQPMDAVGDEVEAEMDRLATPMSAFTTMTFWSARISRSTRPATSSNTSRQATTTAICCSSTPSACRTISPRRRQLTAAASPSRRRFRMRSAACHPQRKRHDNKTKPRPFGRGFVIGETYCADAAAASFSAAAFFAAAARSAAAFCAALNFSFSSGVGIGSMAFFGQALAHILQFTHLS